MFNVIDVFFILIILICAIVAAAKGFVKELFNKISWIAGILVGCLFAKKLQPFLISVVIVYEPIFSQNFITINYPSLAFNNYTRGSYNFIIGKFVYGISL